MTNVFETEGQDGWARRQWRIQTVMSPRRRIRRCVCDACVRACVRGFVRACMCVRAVCVCVSVMDVWSTVV